MPPCPWCCDLGRLLQNLSRRNSMTEHVVEGRLAEYKVVVGGRADPDGPFHFKDLPYWLCVSATWRDE